uniref:Protein kinase domain-containing protein n=1 Tax=Noctiluca scintillans TaxID=2966 RepID=A0A7S1FBJ5_NOCSC
MPDAPLDGLDVAPSELEFLEKIGSGCTAEVFRGILRGKVVAIKQIDWKKGSMEPSKQRSFDREVAVMKRVNHPNLVAFLGVTSDKSHFCIVTEFCAGDCCFELLHNSDNVELCWRQQLKMCSDVAKAMVYLHNFDPQIIHRDLKSLNLLLVKTVRTSEDKPEVKVSDFGLSRMKDKAEDEWTSMTTAAGTCHWMAPEVAAGSVYDEKVDVYSFAMILFEVICREIPYEDEEPSNVGRLTLEGVRPDLEAVPPDCPEMLRDLMIVCWHADPKQRPPFDKIYDILKLIRVR